MEENTICVKKTLVKVSTNKKLEKHNKRTNDGIPNIVLRS